MFFKNLIYFKFYFRRTPAIMARKLLKLKLLAFIILCIVCLGTVFFMNANISFSSVPRRVSQRLFRQVNEFMKTGRKKLAFEGQACRVPILDVNATAIMKLIKEVPKVFCKKKRDWVEVNGSTAKISNWAKRKYGDIECSFTEIIRKTDHSQHQGLTTTTHLEYNFESTDVVRVHCVSENGDIWEKVLIGIRSDQEILDSCSWSKVPEDSLKLNVLIFGFDSLSHNMWKRQLPKTYKYATEDLKGIALNGYNIVGDGTPQALIPMFTGKTELELPDTRKRMGRAAQFVNVYPFIWKDFRKNGYVTAWTEDMADVGTFTYRLKGFNEQPTDHYMRTFYTEAGPYFKHEEKYCYGGLSRFQIFLSFVVNLYEVYKHTPKFAFAFHGEYSHEDSSFVSNADDDVFKWLQEFNRKGYFNDTLLILMSDHGARFSNVRNTQQGKQEERLPGFIFVFPSWFKSKYPEAYGNFVKNADRLSTPFDIHETLKDVLHFRGGGKGSVKSKGISLFKEIPLSRTCEDAGIEPHWCACLNWETLTVFSPTVSEAITYLLDFINRYTSDHRDLCAKLEIGEIFWSAKLIPNEEVLRFKKNADYDGFVGDMSDRTEISTEIYQLKVALSPGDMIFEASIRYYAKEKRFFVSEREISRINKYKNMTHCIEDKDMLHHLRKFCYCL